MRQSCRGRDVRPTCPRASISSACRACVGIEPRMLDDPEKLANSSAPGEGRALCDQRVTTRRAGARRGRTPEGQARRHALDEPRDRCRAVRRGGGSPARRVGRQSITGGGVTARPSTRAGSPRAASVRVRIAKASSVCGLNTSGSASSSCRCGGPRRAILPLVRSVRGRRSRQTPGPSGRRRWSEAAASSSGCPSSRSRCRRTPRGGRHQVERDRLADELRCEQAGGDRVHRHGVGDARRRARCSAITQRMKASAPPATPR